MVTITAEEVRDKSGVPTSQMDDTQIERLISDVTSLTYSHFEINETPTDTIEYKRIYDLNKIRTSKLYIMTVKKITVNDSEKEIDQYTYNENLGKIQPNREYYRYSLFPKDEPYRVKIKYSYAFLLPNGTTDELQTATVAGTSVQLTVTDKTKFSVNDYVRVKGFDGYNEVAKVTAIDDTLQKITVDKLFYSHEAESLIEVVELPNIVKEYIIYETAVAVANNTIGSTYTFNTTIQAEGMSATKGVPYPHWEKNYNNNVQQRTRCEKQIWNMKSRV